jgi:hypothetical protein
MSEKDPPSRDDKVKANYVQHEGLEKLGVDASIIYKAEMKCQDGVGFSGGRFGDVVIIPVTFNWTLENLGATNAHFQDIKDGKTDISDVAVLDKHKQALALDALERVATQSDANIKFVIMDDLPKHQGKEHGIRFGKSDFFSKIVMATNTEERISDANLYNKHLHDITRGSSYSIIANEYRTSSMSDHKITFSFMHEIGHTLGFEHPEAGYHYKADKDLVAGETIMRTKITDLIDDYPLQLGTIDIEAIQQLYGENNGYGAKMVDIRGQPPEVVAKALEPRGYNPAKERAFKEKVMAEAGIEETGNKNSNSLRGTPYNDTYTGKEGNDYFYANGGHDTVTDFKASGNYDFYDWLTGAEEDAIVAPDGALSATAVSELNNNVIITFEDAHGQISDTSIRLENFEGDLRDINILSQKHGQRGDWLKVNHYQERDSAHHTYCNLEVEPSSHHNHDKESQASAVKREELPQQMRPSDYFNQYASGQLPVEHEHVAKVLTLPPKIGP